MLTSWQVSLDGNPQTATDYSYYTIVPGGWRYGQISDMRKYPYIVDSGTTLCYLPRGTLRLLPFFQCLPIIYRPFAIQT